MPALGDRFKKERVKIRHIKQAIELMESRIPRELPPVVAILEKNIGYCKKQLNSIIIEMIKNGYKGEGL